MFAFFRKYERLLFIFITIVIVISFTFFGTYSTLQDSGPADQPVFTAINGAKVLRSEVEDLALFIGTDNEDKLLASGVWGPNFLNDGVVKKDFLEKGLADILVVPYLEAMRGDLEARHRKEKRFTPYAHPEASFINAVNVWNVAAPDIPVHYKALCALDNPISPEAFATRTKLFLAERRFPSPILLRVLHYQEGQYDWVSPDPNLDRTSLALFDYYTAEDWFGPKFLRLIAEFIINSAILAKEQGYHVSKEEALADLSRHAEMSFQQNRENPKLGVASTNQYFHEQLRRMGMDQSRAVALWQKVMLFRRLFGDMGSSVLVDPFSIKQFQHDAAETVQGDLYQLPETFRFNDFPTLQKFEIYLTAVSERPKSELLTLSKTFYPVDKIQKRYPELVQRRFLLDIAKVDIKDLQAKVGVKETWNWEVEEGNWKKLQEKFPVLAGKSDKTREERFASLDSLDRKTRAHLDAFARSQIVNTHPEWLRQTLQETGSERRVVGIQKGGLVGELANIKDPETLIDLLEQYPTNKEALALYTPDQKTYYQIDVIDRSPEWEVLTFAEAEQEGVLQNILDKTLKENEQTPDAYFADILQAIRDDYAAATKTTPTPMLPDYAASLRFYSHMRELREQFRNNPGKIEDWLAGSPSEVETLSPTKKIDDQWKLKKSVHEGNRGKFPSNREEIFSLEPGQSSTVHTRANGDLSFFFMKEKRFGNDVTALFEKVMGVQQLLSIDAQKSLLKHLLKEMQEKNALSLTYLDKTG